MEIDSLLIILVSLSEYEKLYVVNEEEYQALVRDGGVVCYSDLLLNDYYVVLTRDKLAFVKEIAGILGICFVILAVILCFINGISSFSVNSVTREIYDFLDAIREDKAEDLSSYTEEINLIKSKFLELIEKERVTNEILTRTRHEKQALEIEMLQNRINPHLLYNYITQHGGFKIFMGVNMGSRSKARWGKALS